MDGDVWEYHVTTGHATGTVDVFLNIDLKEDSGTYVGDIRLTGNSIDSNSITKMTVYYSLDGTTFHSVKPGRVEFGSGENQISVGMDGVRKLQILFTKTAADHNDHDGRYRYIFSLDSLEIFNDKYDIDKRSVLIAGPYTITDEMGEPVNFTMATLGTDTCCTIPRRSSVSFFLSKDKTVWFPASYTGDSLSVVYFNTSNPVGTYAYLEPSINSDGLVGDAPPNLDLEHGKDLLCNLYISEDYSQDFVLRNTVVKRNTPQSNLNLYGLSSGWFVDPKTLEYRCSFYVADIEGRFLNFGNTSAYLNGGQVTGTIHIPQGYHSFSTSHTSWHDVPAGATSHTQLEQSDPSYPFNHKLMIEGYDYPGTFQGARVYEGVDEYFGSLLQYVSPEEFAEDDNDGNLDIYTVESYEGRLYFKVKLDPSDGSWVSERIKIDYMLRTEDTSDLYLKAIISTRDTSVTPNINSVSVRVV
jgi:hypothetical protein